eukprot:GILI01020167.1.p1 GENE.GILI01020167.1~~GILI01020167.1.p1  ORF type:complete len:760 (-),score=68.53 GILI01020167.1:123-2291(-)
MMLKRQFTEGMVKHTPNYFERNSSFLDSSTASDMATANSRDKEPLIRSSNSQNRLVRKSIAHVDVSRKAGVASGPNAVEYGEGINDGASYAGRPSLNVRSSAATRSSSVYRGKRSTNLNYNSAADSPYPKNAAEHLNIQAHQKGFTDMDTEVDKKATIVERLKSAIVDARTFDTEDSLVLFIDSSYVFLTMIASIILSNLIVAAYPSAKTIAPDEDNDLNEYFNATVQPAILTGLQLPFLLWMCSRAFVRRRLNGIVILDDVRSLFFDYVTNKSFYWDVFMTVPVESAFISTHPAIFAAVASRHFLRWLRCLTLLTSSNPFASLRMWYLFYILLFGFVTFVQISAVIFPMVQGAADGDVPFPFPLTFLTSLYFTVTTVSSVGFGDVYPTQEYSRVFNILVQWLGAIMFAGLTAYLGHFLLRGDEQRAYMSGLAETLEAMMGTYKIPWRVKKDVSLNLQPTMEKYTEMEFFSSILNQVLPLRLANEIKIFQHMKMFSNSIPCFRHLPEEVTMQLARFSEVRFYKRDEPIFKVGDQGNELFLVLGGKIEIRASRKVSNNEHAAEGRPTSPRSLSGRKGSSGSTREGEQTCVEDGEEMFGVGQTTIIVNEVLLATFRIGHYFGLHSLFDSTVRAVSAIPINTAAEVLVLSREKFMLVVDEFPDILEPTVKEQKQALNDYAPHCQQMRWLTEPTECIEAAFEERDPNLDILSDFPSVLLAEANNDQ